MPTFEHRLQQFDPGVIWLDRDHHVSGMNGVASQILGVRIGDVLGHEVLQLHPEKSRDKIAWLLQSAEDTDGCPVTSPPPMTMMINIPDRVLLIKLSRIFGANNEAVGSCLVFFDLTDVTSDEIPGHGAERRRRLFKLPVYKHQRVMLLDMDDLVYLKAGGHYTEVSMDGEHYLCNLSLADLQGRLDDQQFVRVHRSYMVNLRRAAALEREQEQYLLVMDDPGQTRVPVSRSNINHVKGLFGLA
ncbi:PAS domain-containing protein [Aquisalimonas sp. 2447]|uniref:LytTR family DNA-binding domain-containing protein n=1 Tax=Aquisalimonas sp. 2447 TaxID=2740807 RepID=UPI0014323AA6|nr:LytTR family DNA-binding domain-containing protein [Aquisalimonas sp. 2447]QIT56228.1 PAS domain-containing protein [Aquisalimonas sp. 2447]